jgi:hypothetical protein
MKTYCIDKNIVLAFFIVFAVSCRRANEVSIRMMNAKCKASIENYINIDSIKNDTSRAKVDVDNLSKLLPDIEDATQWDVSFLGKRKLGKYRVYSLLLTNGENRIIRLILLKGRVPISNMEVAGNSQLEGYSYKVSARITDDSTIITRKFQTILSDEPTEMLDANDSIITVYRIKPDGQISILKSDTNYVEPLFSAPDDGEYSDEIFYFNGNMPTSWAIAGISNPRAFKDFYMQFRNMVKLNDKDQIANYIKFPLGNIKDEPDFIKNYEKIFSKDIRNAVLGQKIRQLYRDKRGVMIGDNLLWFKQINGNYKIIYIKQ